MEVTKTQNLGKFIMYTGYLQLVFSVSLCIVISYLMFTMPATENNSDGMDKQKVVQDRQALMFVYMLVLMAGCLLSIVAALMLKSSKPVLQFIS